MLNIFDGYFKPIVTSSPHRNNIVIDGYGYSYSYFNSNENSIVFDGYGGRFISHESFKPCVKCSRSCGQKCQ
jgi:hypothetical protein